MPRQSRPSIRVKGGKPGPMPGFIEPCHPEPGKVPARDDGKWAHEVKLDGYRVQAHLARETSVLFTRRGHDWTKRFATIADELVGLQMRTAILDGEVVVPDEAGVPNFHSLHADLAKGRTDRLMYYVFDLLYLDGADLRDAPLRERRDALRRLVGKGSDRVRISEDIHPDGSTLLEFACRMNLEGIVSKQLDAPYRSGRQSSWRKIKCKNSDAFPIVAFVEKLGAKPRRIASLYLGRYVDGRLLYAGKAQSGYTNEDLHEVRERLDPYMVAESSLAVAVKKPKATWVRPVLEAEVEYSAFTADGLLREPVFKGLRDDLAPTEAMTQPTVFRSKERTRSAPSVSRENILQLLPDAVPPTSDDLVAYWKRVHQQALPYLERRPLKLVRHFRGTTYYHKGRLPPIPGSVRQLTVKKREGGEGKRLWVDDLQGLLGLTEMGVVELHPWNATVEDIESADTMVFDLDPGKGIKWPFVVDAALTLRELLEQEGYESWPKLTGGKGIHLMIPLQERVSHDISHQRSKRIAQQLAETDPDRFTVSAAIAARTGRLFIDYLRNGRGTTAVGTFSPRARPGHPIAAPVTWREIEAGIRPDAFTMARPPAAVPKIPGRRGSSVRTRTVWR